MIFSTFLSDVLSALTAALILGFLAWGYSWLRNIRLERALTRSIQPNGVGISGGMGEEGLDFTIQVHNYTNAYIRVRSIALMADKFHIELTPDERRGISQTPLSNEIGKPKFKRIFISKGVLENDGNSNSSVLPPKTMSVWKVWPGVFGQRVWNLKYGYVIFEYATIFGHTAMVRMKIPENYFTIIKEIFEQANAASLAQMNKKTDFI